MNALNEQAQNIKTAQNIPDYENSELYGNREITELFKNASLNRKLAHAYIVEGNRGSGKTLFVRTVSVIISESSQSPSISEKIMTGNCPDISEYSLPEKKKFIPIEYIRQIKTSAYIKPTELNVRIFIINNADTITVPGQNALLKLLEEPPKNVFIFLLCENASVLLPTVRSRASTVRMQKFTREEIAGYLSRKYTESKDSIEYAASRADGSIGLAIELLKNKKAFKNDESVAKAVAALRSGEYPSLIVALSELSSDKSEFDAFLSTLDEAFRDMLLASLGKDKLSYYPSVSEALSARGMLTKKNIILMRDCIFALRNEINYNPNIQTLKYLIAKRLMRAAKT